MLALAELRFVRSAFSSLRPWGKWTIKCHCRRAAALPAYAEILPYRSRREFTSSGGIPTAV